MSGMLVARTAGYLGGFVANEFKDHVYRVRVLPRNLQKRRTQGPFLEPAIDGYVDEVFVRELIKPEPLHSACDRSDK